MIFPVGGGSISLVDTEEIKIRKHSVTPIVSQDRVVMSNCKQENKSETSAAAEPKSEPVTDAESKSKPEPKTDAEAMSKQEAATEAKPETIEAETESPLMLSQVSRVIKFQKSITGYLECQICE